MKPPCLFVLFRSSLMRLLALVLSTALILPAVALAETGPTADRAGHGLLAMAPPVPQEDELLRSVIAAPSRPAADVARDAARHPFETLTFWGLTPGQTVVEIEPGAAGWWRGILEPYARDSGGRYVAVNRPTDGMGVADGSADLVVVARSFHNWASDGRTDPYMAAFFQALKPGGVLAVEQHRSPGNLDVSATAPTGYVSESYVIEAAQRAGFVLDARSELNANPRDDHAHPFGVWTLPPVRRSSGQGRTLTPAERAAFDAVGESDRMTLRFRKPG
jgi:predicted methyltransferase